MKNIVLTGFMGAGKSAVGNKLAQMLNREVIDTDQIIEEESELKIDEIFQEFGEEHFRELEKIIVEGVSELDGHVIVTGGGVVLDKGNIENLRKNGVIVYLHADPETIYNRVKSETHRPLLKVENPLQRITKLLEEREPRYADHDILVDTSNLTVDEVAEKIIQQVEKEG